MSGLPEARGAAVPGWLLAAELVETEPAVALQYLALVDPESFAPVAAAEAGQVLALAARLGGTRLIDNLVLR